MKLQKSLSVALMLFPLVLMCGCASQPAEIPLQVAETPVTETTRVTATPDEDTAPDVETTEPNHSKPPIEYAQILAQEYIDGLRDGEDIIGDEGAIEAFDWLCDRSQLQIENLRPDETRPDTYVCEIVYYRTMDIADRLCVSLYIIFQDETPRLYCPFAAYDLYARRTLDKYLELLKNRDMAGFSAWYMDDKPAFNEEEAKMLLDYYSQFDLSETTLKNWGYNDEQQEFNAIISDKNEIHFMIYLNTGDGLVGLNYEQELASAYAAAKKYYSGTEYAGRVHTLYDQGYYAGGPYMEKAKDVTFGFATNLYEIPESDFAQTIILTREYGGDWEVIAEGEWETINK